MELCNILGFIILFMHKICEELWYWPEILLENSRKTGSVITQLQSPGTDIDTENRKDTNCVVLLV
jgi:hypothetical protein